MSKNLTCLLAVGLCLVPSVAAAQDKYVVHPVRLADESIRFYKGVPTIDIDTEKGAVQISPLPMDHGSFSFSVAVLNKGQVSSDFDVSDVSAHIVGAEVAAFSKEELEKKAKSRAMWTAIAVGLAGGLSAAAAASQRDHYRSTFITPRGTYYGSYSAPSVVGQIQATAIAAGTGYSLVKIQENLDATREALGNNIVQRTTVDPSESYAGQVILKKIKLKKFPENLIVSVRWNGDEYRFGFVVGKRGMKAPTIAPLPPKFVEPASASPAGQPAGEVPSPPSQF
ncbi:hypothetical protein [Sphingomonas koreensis]|uniref:hypothetical protein n=1 Tax=Sphingomonas koreensis TaxID=93064 RepID=UPI000A909371|nr:hypothetical protein [Sphingomonas koreensis]PJI86866.1 hypothetical protein BDW16_0085 [Sphingomonas koreensis]